MKLSYTTEEIEAWRDRVHRRLPHLSLRSKQQAVRFVNDVGFCLVSSSEHSELPSLLNAACGDHNLIPFKNGNGSACLAFVHEMKKVLTAERKAFYGHLFRRRPSLISTELFPFFYSLSHRTGSKDDYVHAFRRGELSARGNGIMEALGESTPQSTRVLRVIVAKQSRLCQRDFQKALMELQEKFYIVRVSNHSDPARSEWNTVDTVFPRLVRKARNINADEARREILKKYFENELVVSVQMIHRLFGWKRPVIYQTLGHLIKDGVITGCITIDGKQSRCYCLIRQAKKNRKEASD